MIVYHLFFYRKLKLIVNKIYATKSNLTCGNLLCRLCVILSVPCAFECQKKDRASVWLSKGSSASRPHSCRLWVHYFLDCPSRVCGRAPRSFPYFKAFYSSGSSPLWDSDFAVFSFVVARPVYSLCLSLSACVSRPPRDCLNPWLNSNSNGPHLRWLVYSAKTAKHQCPLLQLTSRSHAHSVTHSLSSPLASCLLQPAYLTLAVYGGRHTPYLYPTHQSDFESCTSAKLHRYMGAQSDSKSGCLRCNSLVQVCL